jgi:hypothetical protein
VIGCETTPAARNSKCPLWLKPIPKDDSPYDEAMSDNMVKFLFDYQQEFEIRCK